MSKGLEALNKIIDMALEPNGYQNFTNGCDKKYYQIIEKELKDKEKYFKAIDFLLENGLVDVGYDEEEGSYYINLNCGKILISDEEYNLWKGILDNE